MKWETVTASGMRPGENFRRIRVHLYVHRVQHKASMQISQKRKSTSTNSTPARTMYLNAAATMMKSEATSFHAMYVPETAMTAASAMARTFSAVDASQPLASLLLLNSSTSLTASSLCGALLLCHGRKEALATLLHGLSVREKEVG